MANKAKAGEMNPADIRKADGKDKAQAGNSWKAEGMQVAAQFMAAEGSASATKWKLAQSEAEKMAGNKDSIDAFLDGFAMQYSEIQGKDVAKVRKSELRAVIEAWYVDSVKLSGFVGEWNDRVKFARELRGHKVGGKAETVKVKLTDVQQGKVLGQVDEADGGQAYAIAYRAIQRMGQKHAGDDGSNLVLVNACIASIDRIRTTDAATLGMVEEVKVILNRLADSFKVKSQVAEKGKELAEEQAQQGSKQLKKAA